jgi:hypothetical protein
MFSTLELVRLINSHLASLIPMLTLEKGNRRRLGVESELSFAWIFRSCVTGVPSTASKGIEEVSI